MLEHVCVWKMEEEWNANFEKGIYIFLKIITIIINKKKVSNMRLFYKKNEKRGNDKKERNKKQVD